MAAAFDENLQYNTSLTIKLTLSFQNGKEVVTLINEKDLNIYHSKNLIHATPFKEEFNFHLVFGEGILLQTPSLYRSFNRVIKIEQ